MIIFEESQINYATSNNPFLRGHTIESNVNFLRCKDLVKMKYLLANIKVQNVSGDANCNVVKIPNKPRKYPDIHSPKP